MCLLMCLLAVVARRSLFGDPSSVAQGNKKFRHERQPHIIRVAGPRFSRSALRLRSFMFSLTAPLFFEPLVKVPGDRNGAEKKQHRRSEALQPYTLGLCSIHTKTASGTPDKDPASRSARSGRETREVDRRKRAIPIIVELGQRTNLESSTHGTIISFILRLGGRTPRLLGY